MTSSKKITIVGCGFAGLSAAIFLSDEDCEITLYDKFENIQAVGAGILIQPSSLEILKKLDLYDAVVSAGEKVFVLSGMTHYQKEVFLTRYQDYKKESFGIGIHRSIIFDLLYEKCKTRKNIHFVFSHEIKSLEEIKSCSDLVIIANGSHSTLRKEIPVKQSYRLYPFGCAWTSLPEKNYSHNKLSQYVKYSKEMFGILPSGTINKERMVSVFWSIPLRERATYSKEEMFSQMHKYIAHREYGEDLLNRLRQKDFAFALYADVRMKQYNYKNIVVIGDAAHGMSPQLGQGANMALLDGYFLNKYLDLNDIENSLALYSKQRKNHLRFYAQASKFLTPLFQSDFIMHGLVRDMLFTVSQKLPFSQKLSSQIMCGKRQGWFSAKELEY